MAMRQRPKLANYSARNDLKTQLKKSTSPKESLPPNERIRQREGNGETNNQPKTIIPKKVITSKTVESKRIRHASSGKPVGPPIAEKASEGGGVMTKFRSLDDIPDLTDDYNPFEVDEEVEDESYYANPHSEVVTHHPQRSAYYPQHIQHNHNPPPLPLEMNRGNYNSNYHKNYSDPEEESEIEEDDDIPKLQYGGGGKWAPAHPPPPRNDYDDDWNSDDGEDYNHLPPLPSTQKKPNSKATASHSIPSKPQQNKSTNARHPSPIIYDPKAYLRSEDQQSNSPQSIRSPEEKLFFDRQPRDVEYKPYTLKDYRKIKPQQYIELGKLKPDLNTDELVAKRANAERIKEFSKNLKAFNKNVMPKRDGNVDVNQKTESKKEKAIQYAQNIPKPKVKAEPKLAEPKNVGVATEAVEVSRLDELTSKHLQSRKQVDAIKKSLGL